MTPSCLSVIPAIRNYYYKTEAIRKNCTNVTILTEFILIFIDNLKIKILSRITKAVLDSDGTRYHKVKEVDRVLKEIK